MELPNDWFPMIRCLGYCEVCGEWSAVSGSRESAEAWAHSHNLMDHDGAIVNHYGHPTARAFLATLEAL